MLNSKCIIFFLKQQNVISDNNGSERVIRNIKLKQKNWLRLNPLQA